MQIPIYVSFYQVIYVSCLLGSCFFACIWVVCVSVASSFSILVHLVVHSFVQVFICSFGCSHLTQMRAHACACIRMHEHIFQVGWRGSSTYQNINSGLQPEPLAMTGLTGDGCSGACHTSHRIAQLRLLAPRRAEKALDFGPRWVRQQQFGCMMHTFGFALSCFLYFL